MKEFILTTAGYRKAGAIEAPRDKRNYSAHEKFISSYKPILGTSYGKDEIFDNRNIPEQDQGTTAHCVAYAWAHACSIILTKEFGRLITIEGSWLAQMMVIDGVMTEKGAWIINGAKTIMKHGVKDTSGVWYEFEAYGDLHGAERDETIEKGWPIVTGALIGYRMCDSDWNWIPQTAAKARGGHAFCETGKDPERKMELNSWYRYGEKMGGSGRGRFYVKNEDRTKLMTSFTIWGPRVVFMG